MLDADVGRKHQESRGANEASNIDQKSSCEDQGDLEQDDVVGARNHVNVEGCVADANSRQPHMHVARPHVDVLERMQEEVLSIPVLTPHHHDNNAHH